MNGDKSINNKIIEGFMSTFDKLFTSTKYNLESLNFRMSSLEKCFDNILLLNSNKPFNEEDPDKEKNEEDIIANLSDKEIRDLLKEFEEVEASSPPIPNCFNTCIPIKKIKIKDDYIDIKKEEKIEKYAEYKKIIEEINKKKDKCYIDDEEETYSDNDLIIDM